MPRVIELKGGKIETLFSERDFAYLIEEHMGYEQYREEGEEYDE